MRLLLDTTYLLPAIGVSIRDLPKDAWIRLAHKGHQIALCDISMFELSAKGAKLVVSRKLHSERVTRGIKAIMYDENVEIIPSCESIILSTAFRLRSMLADFIDCLILSSAVNRCDALVTEDNDIQGLKRNREFGDLLKTANPEFEVRALSEML